MKPKEIKREAEKKIEAVLEDLTKEYGLICLDASVGGWHMESGGWFNQVELTLQIDAVEQNDSE